MKSWRILTPTCLLLALIILPVSARPAQATAPANWQASASMSTPRYGPAVTTGLYGAIFVAGGNFGSTYLSSAEVYNPSLGYWHTVADMDSARVQAAATTASGKIYVLGGRNESGYLNTVEAYTPGTNTWEYVASMPTARAGLAAVTGTDGKVYAIGGYNASGALKVVEVYSPTTGTWSSGTQLLVARRGLASVVSTGGSIYAIGGSSLSYALATVEVYSMTSHTWHFAASMRSARVDLAASLGADGRIYAIGGRPNVTASSGISGVEAYSTSANFWTSVTSMLTPRYGLGAALAGNDLIYAVGGMTSAVVLRTAEAYPVIPPATAPGAPASVQAVPSLGHATVSWSVPDDGGSTITGYVITAYLGSTNGVAAQMTVGPQTTTVILPLTNGFTYTIGVRAINAIGTSVETRTATFTMATVPVAPSNVVVTTGIGTLTASWTAPASNGGSDITGYLVTVSNGNPAETRIISVGPSTTSTMISGLTNGRTYSVSVAAVNAVGTGAASAPSLPATLPTVPGLPTNVTVTPVNATLQVTWSAPSTDGGRSITSYSVTASDGVHVPTIQRVVGTSVTFTGLRTATNYTVTVIANNAVGSGSGVTHIVLLPNAVPTLQVPDALTVDHGDLVNFTVRAADVETADQLTLTSSGLPNGVHFADLGNGVGQVTGNAEVAAGTYSPSFTVSDSHNAVVTKTVPLTVNREQTVIALLASNPTSVKVAKSTDKLKSVTLGATIREVTDPNGYADIGEAAPVTYTLKNLATGTTYASTSNNSGGGIEGTLATKHTFGNLPIGVYRLTVSVGGSFYQGSADTMFTISSKTAVGSTQGSAILMLNGTPGSASFNIKYGKNGKAQGTMKVVEPAGNLSYSLKATSINGLVIKSNKAFFQGTASLNGFAGYRFVATAIDNHGKGKASKFGLWLVDPNHATVSGRSYDPIGLFSGKITVKNK